MFYEVENMIAEVIGYDSIRKHLAECERQEEKEILSAMSGCVHRYKDTFKGLVREEPEE